MQSGPFSEAALAMAQFGLAVIPVAGEGGKVPLVRWATWTKRPGTAFLTSLAEKHGHQNIGVLCGLSNLTVVDVDDPTLADRMISRCGSTPLVTETPSGGLHFYYRNSQEMCANLRNEGLSVDVKARGGFVVAPPSIRPSGPHEGKVYRIIQGSWGDLDRLPTVKPGSLRVAEDAPDNASGQRQRRVQKGSRNCTLFGDLLRHVRGCDDFDALLDVASHLNGDTVAPLGPAEVEKTAQSVWQYEQRGKNWCGKEAHAVTTAAELNVLRENPNALLLRCLLQTNHGARREPFCISPAVMKEANLVPGWSKGRYIAARGWLVERGFIEMLHEGGRGPRDPSIFMLSIQEPK
jgi:hypothetical protein